MDNIKELLPIGSVVLLENALKKVMIIGIKPVNKETEVEYDYIAVMYPEGYMGNQGSFLFNHSDITDVVFHGYSNPERERFIEAVAEVYASAE